MFERYTEKARRTIFFARYEASAFGSPYIETEHLLLGLLREDPTLSMRFFHSRTTPEVLRGKIERHSLPGEKLSTSADIPLSNECKRILAYAGEEAERLAHPFIGTEHLFLGILREQNCFASQLLQQHGINVDDARTDIAERQPPIPGLRTTGASAADPIFFQLVLKVTNIETSIDFYTKLGFTRAGEAGPGTAVLSNGRCNLRLDQNLAVDRALSFASRDITPIVARLQAAGIQFEQHSGTEPKGSLAAVVRDPDGNTISFYSPPPSIPPTAPQ